MKTMMDSFVARDGITLAWQEMQETSRRHASTTHQSTASRPLILLHGLFSNGEVNWIKYGHAARIAAAGFRVIMPDLRAHGRSTASHEKRHYPSDVLVHDLEDFLTHLGLDDFDLGGFSLGARTSLQAVIAGMRPRRLILGGIGLAGLSNWRKRRDFFKRAIAEFASTELKNLRRSSDTWLAIQFMKTMKIDHIAASLLLDSFTEALPASSNKALPAGLAALTMPTLLVCGEQDQDNGSSEKLAAALPNAIHKTIAGTHMSSVTNPALADAILGFLAS